MEIKMKKSVTAVLCICLLLMTFLSGCGSSSVDTTPLIDEEITKMYSDPDSYKGRTVELTGKVFNVDGSSFQMWHNPSDNSENTVVDAADVSDLSVKSGDYVIVKGTIEGKTSGTNAFGAAIDAPEIKAESVTVSDYQTVVSPTLKTVDVNQSQEQSGVTVTLEKIEFAAGETRIYVKIDNQSGAQYTAFEYSASVVQNGTQYEYAYNYEASYPTFPDSMQSGVSAEAVIPFPAMDSSAGLQFSLDGYSSDYSLNIDAFTFDVAAG